MLVLQFSDHKSNINNCSWRFHVNESRYFPTGKREKWFKKITHRVFHDVLAMVLGKTHSNLYELTEPVVAIDVDDVLVPDAKMDILLDTDMVTHNLVVFEWALAEYRELMMRLECLNRKIFI